MSPVRAFATIFAAVFLFIFLGTAAITFALPEQYRASARVVTSSPAQVEFLRSIPFLDEVAVESDLAKKLAARFGEKAPEDPQRVRTWLRRNTTVNSLGHTAVVEFSVLDRIPKECAALANYMALAAVRSAPPGPQPMRILEQASVPVSAIRPNKPLNLALGAMVGAFLGTFAGGVGAKLAVGFDGRD